MMKQSIKNLIFMIILMSISSILSSCTNSGNSANTSLQTNQSNDLKISKSSVIPVLNGSPTTTGIYVHNTTNHEINQITYATINSSSGSHLSINSPSCTTIQANQSCLLTITTPSLEPLGGGGDVIVANYNNKQSSQLINYSYVDSNLYSGVTFAGASIDLIGSRDYATVYAFVGANQAASNVSFKSSNNSVGVVNGLTNGGTNIGVNQVLPIEIVSSDNITNTNVSITPVFDSTAVTKVSKADGQHIQNGSNNLLQVTLVPTANSSNLIMSYVGVLTASNQSVIVTVYNSGNANATSISLSSNTPDIVVSDHFPQCNSVTLVPHNMCQYTVALDTTSNSGTAFLSLNYNGPGKQSIVYYQNVTGIPMVGITPANSSLTIALESTAEMVFNVHNYGLDELNSLSITASNGFADTSMTVRSNNCGGSVTPGGNCNIIADIDAGNIVSSGFLYVTLGGMDSLGNSYSFVSTPVTTSVINVPPTLTTTTPANGASAISQATGITLNFSESMNPTTLNTTNIRLLRTSDDAVVALTSQGVSNNNQTVNFILSSGNLDELTAYKIVINPSAITDSAGIAMNSSLTESIVATFTTGDSVAPTITSFAPSLGATGVSQTPTMNVQFSEAMDVSTLTTSSIMLEDNNGNVFNDYTISYDVNTYTATLVLDSGAELASDTTYHIFLDEVAIEDLAGNAIGATLKATLTTFTTGDYTAPTITSVSPVNGVIGVPLATGVSITFSEAMDTTTLTTTNIRLYRESTASDVSLASPVYSNGNRTVSFSPTVDLAESELYSIIINPSAITDTASLPIDAATSLTISQFMTTPSAPVLVLSGFEGMKTYNGTTVSDVYDGMAGLNSVTYGNGLYVAVGQNGFITTSLDGVTWTHALWDGLFDSATWGYLAFNSVTYGNGVFVAVGSSGLSAYSTDGLIWEMTGSPGSTSFNQVSYMNNQFVVISGSNSPYQTTVLTSNDGATWSSQVVSTYNFSRITYDSVADMYIAAGKSANDNNVYIVSASSISDLSDPTNSRKTVTSKPITSIISYNGITILGGYDSTLSLAKSYFYRSTDAINFTESSSLNLQPASIVYDTSADRFVALGCYVIVGGGGCGTATTGVSVSEASDGVVFMPASQVLGSRNPSGAIFANGQILGVTNGAESLSGYYGYTMASPDNGANWTISGVIPNMSFGSNSFAGGYYIGTGTINGGAINSVVWSSVDGANWVANTGGLNQDDKFYTNTYSNGNYIVAGQESDLVVDNRKNAVIYRATNPTSWTKVVTDNNEGKTISALNARGNLVVAIGSLNTNTATPYLLTSDDNGVSWTDNTFNISGTSLGYSNKVANNGSRFVAVGSGTIYYSDDGVDWTDTGVTDYNLYDISYHNGIFIAVGEDNATYTVAVVSSTDGVNWTRLSSPAFTPVYQFFAVGYYKNYWYIAGTGGALLRSSNNGVSWGSVFSINVDNINYVGLLGS